MGSPFTALLCGAIGRGIDRETAVGRRVLGWPGNPDGWADGLPLRLCGGLHALVRRGEAPELARLYPPQTLPDEATLWQAVERTFAEAGDKLLPWLDGPPQTNEVGRGAALMSGLLVVAARFGLPIELYELGASAGLNLLLDRYRHDLGGVVAGDSDSALRLRPDWEGPAPPEAVVRILGRRGVDLRPADVIADRERLLAYVWADQAQRLAQLEAALAIAADDPPPVDAGDAADWLETRLATGPAPGRARIVMHSVAYQYFPPRAQARIAAHIAEAGAHAREDAPLAWLRFEKEPGERETSLRLTLYPRGEERLLASCQAHGRAIGWLG
jgi:hypothetical protein